MSPEELDNEYALSRAAISSGSSPDLQELHFYLCILSARDNEAKLMLQRLLDRFGYNLESLRLQKMVATYEQATGRALTDSRLKSDDLSPRAKYVLDLVARYQKLMEKKAENVTEYVSELAAYLDDYPTDTEAWAEIADMYAATGNYELAISSLRQVLLQEPNAYNVWARIGELRHLQATTLEAGIDGSVEQLTESAQALCRSVELCPSYVRGWTGLYVVSSRLVQWPKSPNRELYIALQAKARTTLEQMTDPLAKKVLQM